MTEEMSVHNFYFRNARFQSPYIGLLSDMFLWVMLCRMNSGGEILYSQDIVTRIQQPFAHSHQIQPFVRSVLYRPVIKIKPINVDIGP